MVYVPLAVGGLVISKVATPLLFRVAVPGGVPALV
jgi:hypothetical protein